MNGAALARNNVTVLGHGPRTLVFGHGFGGDQRSWRFVAPHFVDDYRVVLFDHAGCGRSQAGAFDPARYSSLHGYARDVIEICEALDVRDVTFIGHSMSGTVGLMAALAEPERIARLALIASTPCVLNEPPGYMGGFTASDIDGLLDLMDTNFVGWAATLADAAMKDSDLAAELRAGLSALDPSWARPLANVIFRSDIRGELAKVGQPVLIVQCTRDDIAPVSGGEYMHAHLRASTLRLLDTTGHCPQMSDPQAVTDILRNYLARATTP